MGNKKIYKKIEGLQRVIDEHLEKIENELAKDSPNFGRIHHWDAEINAARERIARLQSRIGD